MLYCLYVLAIVPIALNLRFSGLKPMRKSRLKALPKNVISCLFAIIY